MKGRPWPDDSIVRSAFSSLVNWYTTDEIALLMGRTQRAIRRKMALLKIRARWTRTHGGGVARIWQRQEEMLLHWRCEHQTQREVAKDLGFSVGAVNAKWRKFKTPWNQGRIGLADIARAADCSVQYVSTRAKEVFKRPPAKGTGRSRRYNLTVRQAEKLMEHIRPGRVSDVQKIFDDN